MLAEIQQPNTNTYSENHILRSSLEESISTEVHIVPFTRLNIVLPDKNHKFTNEELAGVAAVWL